MLLGGADGLRFLSFAAPGDRDWIAKQLTVYNDHFGDRRRYSGVQKYYWMILADLPPDIAQLEIVRYKEQILDYLS